MSTHSDSRGRRTVWAAIGLVVAVAIGVALYAYVGTVLFAVFLYYATRPLERKLRTRFDHPNTTVAMTILLVVLPMVAVVGYAGLLALSELDQFLAAADLEGYRSMLDPYLSLASEGDVAGLREAVDAETGRSVVATLQSGLPAVFGQVSSIAGFVGGVLVRVFLMFTILYYLLRDDQKLATWFSQSVDDEELVAFLDGVDDDLETIFLSNLAIVGVAAVVGTVTYLGLNLLVPGQVVPTPVLLAFLIGIGTLIPAVGMKIVYLPYGLFLLGDAILTGTPLWHPILFLVLSFVVVDTVPDFFARSILSARSGVHMGLVLLAYFLGTLAFGWYGLFLGPIVVVFAAHFAHEVFPELASDFLADEPPA